MFFRIKINGIELSTGKILEENCFTTDSGIQLYLSAGQ
jgi:hypothetical protein